MKAWKDRLVDSSRDVLGRRNSLTPIFRYGSEIFWGTGDVMTKWGCDALNFSYGIIDIKNVSTWLNHLK